MEKPGILSEKLKTLTSSNNHRVDYFSPNFARFPLTNIYKRVFGIYFLNLELFAKIKKSPGFYTLTEATFFTLLSITRNLNKILKNTEHPFVDIVRQKTCAKFQQKILNHMVVGARQSF